MPMNILEVQDKLKNFSQEQLIGEMQQPSGQAPQYLVLGEMQRRKRMAADAQAQAAKSEIGTTVANDAVSAAGVPQEGIAQVGQAMAPRSSIAQNTGVNQTQPEGLAKVARMRSGGGVHKMADGGLINPASDPEVVAYAAKMGMSVERLLAQLSPEELQAVQDRISNRNPNPVDPSANNYGYEERTSPDADSVVNRPPPPPFVPLRAEGRAPTPSDLHLNAPPSGLMMPDGSPAPAPFSMTGGEGGPGTFPAPGSPSGLDQLSSQIKNLLGMNGAAADAATAPDGTKPGVSDPAATPNPKVGPAPRPAMSSPMAGPGTGGIAGVSAAASGAAPAGAAASTAPKKDESPIERAERIAKQDKWFAVAQAGLALMSSTAPNLGAAIGEAGLVGLQGYRASRDKLEGAITEQEKIKAALAAAAAKAAGRAGHGGRGGMSLSAIDSARESLMSDYGEIDPISGKPTGALKPGVDPAVIGLMAQLDQQKLSAIQSKMGIGGISGQSVAAMDMTDPAAAPPPPPAEASGGFSLFSPSTW